MTSRKIILTKKLIEFQQLTKEILPENTIFPTLEQFDLTDILIMFDMNFSSVNTKEEYIEVMESLLKFNNVKLIKEKKDKLFEISIKFINWLKEFQQK